ncbi:MAG: CPBP family intramembrane metalloprotease [Geodermatophilaceae bacterium]|nr:CPBP family intramembrane metalloprotease [Geodermatophilaceae bacterium]
MTWPVPMPAMYGWVPQYYWDPRWGWVPQYVWHPQYGWVHGFIWAPLPPGWILPSTLGPQGWEPQRHGKAPHPQPTAYLQLLRTPTYGWWKSLLGLLLAVTVWFVGSVVLLVVAIVARGGDADGFLDDIATDPLGAPTSLLIVNLNLALLIPSVWVALLAVHQERLGWVSSVVRRLRWRLMLVFGSAATGLLAIGLVLGYLIVDPVAGSGEDSYDSGFIVGMLAVVLLTTPLQAAGEEYFFRGYLSQVIAGWIPPRAAGAIVAGLLTGSLFALAHGSQDVPTFLSRLAFGLTASLVAWLTGGLEASIAYHVMNNVLLFLLALVVGPSLEVEISGALVLTVDVLVMLAYVTFVWCWLRRRPVQRLTGGPAPAPVTALERSLSAPSRLG